MPETILIAFDRKLSGAVLPGQGERLCTESELSARAQEAFRRGVDPALGLEIARRLLAGYEPPSEVVSRLCDEALAELFPERENLELLVSPRDAHILESLHPEWKERYPGLRISCEPTLVPGDCQVRSRFGLIDGRIATKLGALESSLSPA